MEEKKMGDAGKRDFDEVPNLVKDRPFNLRFPKD